MITTWIRIQFGPTFRIQIQIQWILIHKTACPLGFPPGTRPAWRERPGWRGRGGWGSRDSAHPSSYSAPEHFN